MIIFETETNNTDQMKALIKFFNGFCSSVFDKKFTIKLPKLKSKEGINPKNNKRRFPLSPRKITPKKNRKT
jgi:hypothetical protein